MKPFRTSVSWMRKKVRGKCQGCARRRAKVVAMVQKFLPRRK